MTAMTRGLETRLQHPRIWPAPGGEPVASPIYQSSTYILPTPELGAEIAASWHSQRFYTRYGSPNVAPVEAIVADLEGAESAVAIGSGMAAITAAILSNVRAGDHVVAQTAHYTAALTLLTEWLPRQGVEVTQVDQTDLAAFAQAIGPKTRLVYTETPTKPTMVLTELKAVSTLAHAQGAIVVTDNTFASSFNQLPLTLGVDIVVHSATKYLNGHSDVTANIVAGSRKLIEPKPASPFSPRAPVANTMLAESEIRGIPKIRIRAIKGEPPGPSGLTARRDRTAVFLYALRVRQNFFIPIACNPLKSPDSKK